MNWLTVLEFEIHPFVDEETQLDHDEDIEVALESRRSELLNKFHSMLVDAFSPLYTGFVTCKLDPTFSENFPRELEDQMTPVFSSDPTILKIMNK